MNIKKCNAYQPAFTSEIVGFDKFISQLEIHPKHEEWTQQIQALKEFNQFIKSANTKSESK